MRRIKLEGQKYGLLPAFKMAVLYRREQINQLNQQGADYSAQHGKDRNEQ